MKISVFTKILAYTVLLLLLMCTAAGLLFARQFLSFYREEQQRQLSATFQPMIALLSDRSKSPEEIIELARLFASSNQSFRFMIESGDGKIVFITPDTDAMSANEISQGIRLRFMGLTKYPGGNSENGYTFTGYGINSSGIDYGDLIRRLFIALGLMLLIAAFGAVLFAKGVTKPLEDEIVRERAMEENQRLFFSAASHELKTPIASARALVEGMLAGVGDYKDHRKYLRECLKTLDSQARLVSEILEIVKLSDNTVRQENNSAADLREAGNAVLDEYQPLAGQRGLVIEGVFPRVIVQADRNLLQRVLSNVIANAVQNTPEGGFIKISYEKEKTLRLFILNTGAQIPDEIKSRLFEPFFHMDNARTMRGTQSGLGLAIVKKTLDHMAVPFALENTPEGVLFRMELRLCEKTTGKLQANYRLDSD